MVRLKELETWLTSGETAAVLSRTKQGTINLAKSGRVRGVKTRAGWLYDPKSVEAFAAELAAHSRHAGAEERRRG